MINDDKTLAALLRKLALGQPIDRAAAELSVSSDRARQWLNRMAQHLDPPPPAATPPISGSVAVAYIDGGARGNPGPAGSGAVLMDPDGQERIRMKRYLGETTNNVAEYSALVMVLEKAVALGIESLEIRSDSQLLVRQMSGRYKVKSPNLIPLFLKAQALARGFERVVYTHVPREQNRLADRLANEAMDQKNKTEPW